MEDKRVKDQRDFEKKEDKPEKTVSGSRFKRSCEKAPPIVQEQQNVPISSFTIPVPLPTLEQDIP